MADPRLPADVRADRSYPDGDYYLFCCGCAMTGDLDTCCACRTQACARPKSEE